MQHPHDVRVKRLGCALLSSAASVAAAAWAVALDFCCWCDLSPSMALVARLEPWVLAGWTFCFGASFWGVAVAHARWSRNPWLLWIPFMLCGAVAVVGLQPALDAHVFDRAPSEQAFATWVGVASAVVACAVPAFVLRLACAVAGYDAPSTASNA